MIDSMEMVWSAKKGILWCSTELYGVMRAFSVLSIGSIVPWFRRIQYAVHWPWTLSLVQGFEGAVGKYLKDSGIGNALINSGVLTEVATTSSGLKGRDFTLIDPLQSPKLLGIRSVLMHYV